MPHVPPEEGVEMGDVPAVPTPTSNDADKATTTTAVDTATKLKVFAEKRSDQIKERLKEAGSSTKGIVKEKLEAHPELKAAVLKLDETRARYTQVVENIAKEKLLCLSVRFENSRERLLDKVDDFAKKRIQSSFAAVHSGVLGLIIDPYMPDIVQKAIGTVFNAVWPDIQEEVVHIILKTFEVHPSIVPRDPPPCCDCCNAIIAAIRYFYMPFDKGFWQCVRSPLYLLFYVILFVPGYGVQVVYLFLFCFIDKTDEYQLTQYILGYKSVLFLTTGFLGTVIAAFQFYLCTQGLTGDELPVCSETSPREFVYSLVAYPVQVALVWVAYLLLGQAKKHGGEFALLGRVEEIEEEVFSDAENAIEDEENKNENDNGHLPHLHRRSIKGTRRLSFKKQFSNSGKKHIRLRHLLVYDSICVVFCMILIVLFYFFGHSPSEVEGLSPADGLWYSLGNGTEEEGGRAEFADRVLEWRFEVTLYMVRCVYGVLALPFFLLQLPLLHSLCSHARRTAYTRQGECVPYLGAPPRNETPSRLVKVKTAATNAASTVKEVVRGVGAKP